MATLTVTSRGQVTLRKAYLKHLGIEPGDRIEVDMRLGRKLEMAAARPVGSIENFIGSLAVPKKKALSIEQINQAIADGWAGKVKF